VGGDERECRLEAICSIGDVITFRESDVPVSFILIYVYFRLLLFN
jgi:hypothetical protein